jgi:hypothetical protein
MQESSRLTDFLNSLAEDPDREMLFDKEPVAVMGEFGLSEHHQRLLLSGTLAEIREAIEAEIETESSVLIFMIKMK